MEQKTRKYPVGIQTFSRIIQEGYVYIDKTDLVWQLQHNRSYVFLSRPRRFGKSLLSSTLHSYFAGEKELFEGLKIMQYEQEWKSYPVLHFDLSAGKNVMNAEQLHDVLVRQLRPYEKLYGRNAEDHTAGARLMGVIENAHQQTGRQVVVIIDEYDAPLLEVLHADVQLAEFRRILQEFYQPLKMLEPLLKFCFITGITKFSQLSIFSTINNLQNLTMVPAYSAICGITEDELVTAMAEDIRLLAEAYGCSQEEMHARLKLRYDGYHFSEDSPEIYNPFSLMNAFDSKKVSNYWFASGTPSFLIRQLQHFRTDIMSVDHLEVPASGFDQPTEAMTDALPLLYQAGYLSIRAYDRETEAYTLSLPNQEVRIGYTEGLMPTYLGLNSANVQMGFAAKFWRALKGGDIDLAMREMQAYLAGIPYVEGFKKKLAEAATAEGFYEYTLYLIFSMLNVYVRTQVKCAGGRTDVVVWMPDAIYVLELKVNGTAAEALQQIRDRRYAEPFATDSRRVVKVGVGFTPETMTIHEWKVGFED